MYNGLEARLHDTFWQQEEPSAELNLLEKFLQKHPGTALELGCGSGRLLLNLIKKGFFIEGLDNSTEMLASCQKNAHDLSPTLHLADISNFNTRTTYSAITIPAFTLQFIPPDQLPIVLQNIQNHLHPGGGLYITTFIPWAEITGELEEDIWYPDHETALDDSTIASCETRFLIKRISQQLQREHRYKITDKSGKTLESSTSNHLLHWLWPNELTRILNQAGFSITQTIGDFESNQTCDENAHIITYYTQTDSH